jgi:aquaporin Z
MRKLFAEFLGTFWLVLGGVGSAVFAAKFPDLGIGFLGVSIAFGLTVVSGAYAFGHISGGHFNPAVSLGVWIAGKLPTSDLLPYMAAQVLGAIGAAGILYIIVTGNGSGIGEFGANGYGDYSPGKYNVTAAFITELVMTFMFLIIILGSTAKLAAPGFGGLAIGLTLTLIHLISIPITKTSVNPARSISQAIFVGDWALSQLWLFIVAPLAGAALAGIVYKSLLEKKDA